MIEFDFKRPTRKCSVTEQDIGPGQRFVSALVEQANGSLARLDFSEANWTSPPDDCIGWWTSQVPFADKGRVYWAPNDVLLAFFEHALSQPDQQPMAFVMALVLVRKRIVQWRETTVRGQKKYMMLHDAKNKNDYEVLECELQVEEVAELQTDLAEKLFTDQVEHGETHVSPAND